MNETLTEIQNVVQNFSIQAPNPDYIHVAYGLMALGALSVLGDPKRLITVVSAVYLYSNVVNKAKDKLSASV